MYISLLSANYFKSVDLHYTIAVSSPSPGTLTDRECVCVCCAEAISATIDGNLHELVKINGGVRKMVGSVNKASARDKYLEAGGGNGVGGNGKRETQFFATPDIPSTNPR